MDPNDILTELQTQTLISHATLIACCMIFGILLYFLFLYSQKQKNFIPLILFLLMPFSVYADGEIPDNFGIGIDGDTFSIEYESPYNPSDDFSDFEDLTPEDETFTIPLGGFGWDFGDLSLSSDPIIPGFDFDNIRNAFRLVIKLFITLFFVGRVWTTLRQY